MECQTVEWLQPHEKFILPVLEPVSSYFTIPQLDDKPQDPIIQTLTAPARSGTSFRDVSPVPTRASTPFDGLAHRSESVVVLWKEALLPAQHIDRTLSWNPNPPLENCDSPFFTEHPSLLSSLQTQARSSVYSKSTNGSKVVENELFGSLHLVVLGTSSSLYVWDAHLQSFIQATQSGVFPDAKHSRISGSVLQRFLDLGTLVRRLDELTQDLRRRRGRTNTTVHAFAHSLSSALMFIRTRLSRGPLSNVTESGVQALATVWYGYAALAQTMASLASMCSRSLDIAPEKFPEIPSSPVDLLSLVYETFETHIERHSPSDIIAVMAYILTVSSKPYIHELCKLLAYGEACKVSAAATDKHQYADLTFQYEGDEVESSDGGIDVDGPFAKFIPENLARILPTAHRSLRLLEAAKPDHPIFSADLPSNKISWNWTEKGIKNLWNGVDESRPVTTNITKYFPDIPETENSSGNNDPLAGFEVFDMEPGFFFSLDRDSQVVLEELVANFPNSLPNIIPSPSLLCEVMFTPLQDHAASLSRALLGVFLDRSSFLCVDAHLELLRSHMLLTSHPFKSRLSAALFSDAEDRTSHSVQLYNLLRYKSKGMTIPDQSYTSRWPVGLAPLLVTKDSWPPGGSELSFLLRTVIVDSQQNHSLTRETPTTDLDGAHQVLAEAEYRLGFAIRELSGRGRERWLDPLSIEALDFLYLDYKVPQPLRTLIPTTVVSKYQRMFALLLRLTRVECAIRSVFRLTRASASVLFPTLSSARALLLHFRFVAHAFLSTLSSYIYDTAIGGNFDAFLLRIAACRENPDVSSSFRDVFALADCHSSVLDDILEACLLRSTQRAASDLLRGTLEVVLQFCILVGDLKDGRTVEYQASAVLDSLYASFRKKVSALMRALEFVLEKHGKSQGTEQLQAAYPEWESRVPPGGVDALRHLLTSLNQNEWWTWTR